MKTKIFSFVLWLFLLSISSASAYEEINCSSSSFFTEHWCHQCFEGGVKQEGDNLGLLSDQWINNTDFSQLMYKEEQSMNLPYMVNLNEGLVSWSQTPESAGFWEYTEELEELYDEVEQGYVLEAGEKVTWLKSKLGYAYNLEQNEAPEGEVIGMFIYPLGVHTILEDGEITIDDEVHKECVIFTSWTTPQEPTTPKQLPETGPEHIILLALAFLIGLGLIRFSAKKS